MILKDNCYCSRRELSLPLDQLLNAHVGIGSRGTVPLNQDFLFLRFSQQRQLRNRPLRILDHPLQQSLEMLRHSRDCGLIE